MQTGLMGRVRMADWIKMPESQFAREIERLEKDPLFLKLRFGAEGSTPPIARSRWPRSSFGGDFYELTQNRPASGERVGVEEALDEDHGLADIIRRMGREAFERYYLFGDEALPLPEIARRTGLEPAEARRVHELLLELGAQAEFGGAEASGGLPSTCVAAVSIEENQPYFQFLSPHWARGLYAVRYDSLEHWKSDGLLDRGELKRLPRLLRRIEIINLRQNTLFRIFDQLIRLQAPYFRSRREEHKLPISLRKLAAQLELAPSTVCRAVAGRSVRLPWGKEVPLGRLLPGRRKVMRAILSRWLDAPEHASDRQLSLRLRQEHGISVSRRTVNAIRHELGTAAGASGRS